jgi:REP element-mobilizing transposase RayT
MLDLPIRKPNRLIGYDYSQEGCYFITICTKDKRPVLCRITVADSIVDGPKVTYSAIGDMLLESLESFNTNYQTAHIDKFVIMPNHVHILLKINGGTPRTASPTKASVPKIINAFKSYTSKKYGQTLWQRGYHDHIIRDETDYLTKWNYINTNPARWIEDEYYQVI